MKTMKYLIIIFGVFSSALIFRYLIHLNAKLDSWKERATPLPASTIQTLCDNFNLKKDDSLCNQTKEVYAPDFYKIIRDTFRPHEYRTDNSESSNYAEVETKIGVFRYECEPAVYQADGFSYFSCSYDFQGDREFIMEIMYSLPEETVFRINTPMGLDGE